MRIQVQDHVEALLHIFYQIHMHQQCCQEPCNVHVNIWCLNPKGHFIKYRRLKDDHYDRHLNQPDPQDGVEVATLHCLCDLEVGSDLMTHRYKGDRVEILSQF